MTKLSKISFFLFVSIYNYLWLRIIMFHYFYNEYGSMGIFYVAIIIVSILLFFAVIPKKLMLHSYEDAFKKSLFKYMYTGILILENIFGVSFCVYLLSKIFIPSGNFYAMLGIISITLVAISYYKPRDVMQVSTLFIIVGYGILALTLFFYPNLDTSLFLPVRMTSLWAIPFFILMFIGDNFTFLINKKEVQFSRLTFIMAMFFSLLLFGAEYFILIANVGDVYLKGIQWVGFISLSIEPITKYFGNFEFAYIFYIMICCIFKYSYNLSLIRDTISIHQHVMSGIFFAMLVILGIVCYVCIPMNTYYFGIIAILLMLSSIIFFWFLKECYYVRKSKE